MIRNRFKRHGRNFLAATPITGALRLKTFRYLEQNFPNPFWSEAASISKFQTFHKTLNKNFPTDRKTQLIKKSVGFFTPLEI